METLFGHTSIQHFAARIESLTPETRPEWGKMNVQEMLAHCNAALGVPLGTVQLSRSLVGRLFGRIAKAVFIKPGKPFTKNGPTDPRFIFKAGDVSPEKVEKGKTDLVAGIEEFHRRGAPGMPTSAHPFFGKLTPDEWDLLSAKHIDHHLRQFGV